MWVFVHFLRVLPRGVARWVGAVIGGIAYLSLGRLRRVGLGNLAMAMPDLSALQREQVLREEYRNLGWLLAEFCQMSSYT